MIKSVTDIAFRFFRYQLGMLDLEDFPKGIFILEVTTDDMVATGKLVRL